MSRRKKINRFDTLVEKLIDEFIKIPNFDLTQTDEIGNKIFNIVTYRIAEITSYKDLVSSHFIPATNKAIFNAKRDFKNSRFKALLNTNDIDFHETLNDTIRLSYVGLFHKLENYINDVIEIPDMLFGELYETEGSVTSWAKEKFDFNIKDWRQFYITHKINWVANCVKHKDGYPVKEPKPIGFKYVDETQRINIKPEDFKKDCDLLIQFYPIYLQSMFIFGQHKLLTEKTLDEEDWKHSPDLFEKQKEDREKAEKLVQNFVDTLRKLKE